MIMHKKYKNYISTLLLNTTTKQGKKDVAKQLLMDFSIEKCKSQHNFSTLLENLIKIAVVPFNLIERKKKYKYVNYTNCKSISKFILTLLNCVKNKKKRVSFKFYLEKELYKLLHTSHNMSKSKLDLLSVCNSLNTKSTTLEKKVNKSKLIKSIISKQLKLNYTWSLLSPNKTIKLLEPENKKHLNLPKICPHVQFLSDSKIFILV